MLPTLKTYSNSIKSILPPGAFGRWELPQCKKEWSHPRYTRVLSCLRRLLYRGLRKQKGYSPHDKNTTTHSKTLRMKNLDKVPLNASARAVVELYGDHQPVISRRKNAGDLKIAVVSDIHLGHRRNPARTIVQSLMKAFPDNAETGELDIIFIAGDIYDDLLSLPHEDVYEIDMWIAYMLRLCAKHDIVLRLLEGTPGHDWKQTRRFMAMEEVLKSGVDILYADTLSVEYMERFDINVLYVPDEWNTHAALTLDQARAIIRGKGLTQVDYAIMHGQFEYQVPMHLRNHTLHDSTAYLGLVKHLIFIGHHHTHTSYDRIYAQGSFDRLTHGQEEPKGHIRAVIHENGEREIVFVENKDAMMFVTVDCTGLDLEGTLEKIRVSLLPVSEGAHVRIKADKDNPIHTSHDVLIRTYLDVASWSKQVVDDEEDKKEVVEEETLFVPISITKENIFELLMARLSKHSVTPEVYKAGGAILEEAM